MSRRPAYNKGYMDWNSFWQGVVYGIGGLLVLFLVLVAGFVWGRDSYRKDLEKLSQRK